MFNKMSAYTLFTIFVLIAMAQTYSLQQRAQRIWTGREDYNPARVYMYEDGDGDPNILKDRKPILVPDLDDNDPRRLLFISSHDSNPNSEKVSAGLEIFGIPFGPQLSYTKVKNEVEDTSLLGDDVGSILISIRGIYNSDEKQANHKREFTRVPVSYLKQKIIYAKHPESQTFPFEQDTSGSVAISDDVARKNAKISAAAGLQLFGIPIGTQFVYSRGNTDEDGVTSDRESYGVIHPWLSNNHQPRMKVGGQIVWDGKIGKSL